jgi:hypothetical protein
MAKATKDALGMIFQQLKQLNDEDLILFIAYLGIAPTDLVKFRRKINHTIWF